MNNPPTRITIELDPGDPIHGRLIEDSGTADTFYGWLELCHALEWARHRPGAPPGVSALAGAGEATVTAAHSAVTGPYVSWDPGTS